MTLNSGNNQQTGINQAFPLPLRVNVSSFGEPVIGGIVTFTGPGSGASTNPQVNTATVASGIASASVAANGTAGGPYTVTASMTGTSSTVNFSLTNIAPTPTPTNTRTNTPTSTRTNTPTNTRTHTPTNTPVPPTNTPTNTRTNTPTNTATNTQTNTRTNTPTATSTGTPTETPTATPTEIATAIQLASFTGRVKPKGVVLKWQTVSEARVSGFHVWRQSAKGKFKRITKQLIQAKHAGVDEGANYRFKNVKIVRPKKYRYKIEIVLTDGSVSWSQIIKVKVKSE